MARRYNCVITVRFEQRRTELGAAIVGAVVDTYRLQPIGYWNQKISKIASLYMV